MACLVPAFDMEYYISDNLNIDIMARVNISLMSIGSLNEVLYQDDRLDTSRGSLNEVVSRRRFWKHLRSHCL